MEGELDRALIDEVQLLLFVVVMARRGVARRHHDRVDPEGLDAQALADLAKAGPLTQHVQMGDGVPVAPHH